MGFADDVNKFSVDALSNVSQVQNEKIKAFLQEELGDEAKLITSISFDNENLKFYDVKAPESVIAKLRKAGHLRE